MRTLAIDIGGTKVSLARIDFISDEPSIVTEHTVLTGDLTPNGTTITAGHIVDWIRNTSTRVAGEYGDVDAIGVGFGGQFHEGAQKCVTSLHVPGWDGFPLADLINSASPLVGVPIVGTNDANAAAIAEAQSHPFLDSTSLMLYVTLSTGIGGAIAFPPSGSTPVRLVTGVQSLAGEIGHLQVPNPTQLTLVESLAGQVCSCGGTQCLERMCSGYWIEQRTGIAARDYLDNPTNFQNWIADLTSGLWAAITLLDPAVICLGGGMTSMGDRLTTALTQSVAERASRWGRVPPEIVRARWASRSVLLGAAQLARWSHDQT